MTLFERFRLEDSGTIDVGGMTVRQVVRIPIEQRTLAAIIVTQGNTERPQGCLVTCNNGSMLTPMGKRRSFHVLADSLKLARPFRIMPSKGKAGELVVANNWLGPDVSHMYFGNAGIVVETEEFEHCERYLLHCSDGTGEPDFKNLLVSLSLFRESESTAGRGSG